MKDIIYKTAVQLCLYFNILWTAFITLLGIYGALDLYPFIGIPLSIMILFFQFFTAYLWIKLAEGVLKENGERKTIKNKS